MTHLWRKVIGSATQRPGCCGTWLGETKICHLDVSIEIEKYIFRLQVSIDDVFFVEEFESKRHFGRIELGHTVREAL
jgi:hypothetical protein